MTTVKDIIEKWLKENDYSGLVNRANRDFCSCHLDDLIPCGGDYIEKCEAAYEEPCKKRLGAKCLVIEKGKEKNCYGCDV